LREITKRLLNSKLLAFLPNGERVLDLRFKMEIEILTPMKPLVDYSVSGRLKMRVVDDVYFSDIIKKFLEQHPDASIHKLDMDHQSYWSSYFRKGKDNYSIDLKFTLFDSRFSRNCFKGVYGDSDRLVDWDADVWTVIRGHGLAIGKNKAFDIYDLMFGLETHVGNFHIQPGRRSVMENPPLNMDDVNETLGNIDFSELGSLFAEPIKQGLGFMVNYEGFSVIKPRGYCLPINEADENSNDWSIRNLSKRVRFKLR